MNNPNFNWDGFFVPYQLAIGGFIIKFESIRKQYLCNGESSPIEMVTGRVKTPESIMDKARRMNVKVENIPDEIYDIAGVRITCKYVQDVYRVFELLKSRKDIEIKIVKDYIQNPKPSGYRSLHVIASYNVETVDGQKPINIEFQIRTHAMHLWASIEHGLKYKYYRNIPENIKERLVEASSICAMLDKEMGHIKQAIDETNVEMIREDKYLDYETEISVNSVKKWW